MTTSLDLSLPEPPRQRTRSGWLQWLTFLVCAAVLAVLIVDRRQGSQIAGAPKTPPAEAEKMKILAQDLEKRTLYAQAAEAWADYMAAVELPADEKAETLYRRAKCLKEGGRYADAARRLSEVETLQLPRERKQKARQLLLECLDALGKRDVRESVSRSFAVGAEEEKGTVLAKVGGDPILKEELRSDIINAVESALKMQGAPLLPDELSKKAVEIADQELNNPETAKRALMQAVSSHVLYRHGLESGFGEDETMAGAASRFRRQFVANRVIETELEGAMKGIGATELQNHYEAHKDRFIEKPGAEFSFAKFAARGEAEAAIQKLKDAAAQAEVKLERAKEPAAAGQPVPGVGASAEITAHLLAMKEGEVSERPMEHEGAFYVFQVEKQRPERQLAFGEAEARVKADLAGEKRKEAIEKLQTQLSEKYHVEIVEAGSKPPEKPEKPGEKTGEKPAHSAKNKKLPAGAGTP